MKHLEGKKTLLFGGILCLAVTALGATIAYNRDSATLENVFELGSHDVRVMEYFASPSDWKPCDEKEKRLTITNHSNSDIKVRVKIDEFWRNADDTENLPLRKEGIKLVSVYLPNGYQHEWELVGDYYQYYRSVSPSSSAYFRMNVVFDCGANLGADNVCRETANGVVCEKPASDYEGAKYHLKATVQTVQADAADEEWNYALLDTGENVNIALKRLAGTNAASSSASDRNIKSISFVNELPATIDPETADKASISASGYIPVYAYNDGNNNLYIHSSEDKIFGNKDSSEMFENMESLTSLNFSSNFSTSSVEDMGDMFCNVNNIVALSLPESFDTSNVKRMEGMFSFMYRLVSLTFSDSFDTSNVTEMQRMFHGSSRLTSLVLPEGFNTSNVMNMSEMFRGMNSLATLVFPERFDTSNVQYMDLMFLNTSSITSLTLPDNFNTARVRSMSRMFEGMSTLRTLTLPPCFVIASDVSTDYIFSDISPWATLNSSADASVKALWPYQLRN